MFNYHNALWAEFELKTKDKSNDLICKIIIEVTEITPGHYKLSSPKIGLMIIKRIFFQDSSTYTMCKKNMSE